MRRAIGKVRTILGLCAAFTLSACTFSDSLLNGDIRSLWAGPTVAHPVVIFATDREPDDSKFGFGLHWDAATHCGVAQLSIPSAFVAGRAPDWPGVDTRDDVACGGRSEMAGFAVALAHQAALHNCHAALMFVHGYNQTFRSALLRAGQLATDTRWSCASALMSWSSEGKFDRYAADIERSGYAVPVLIELLRATSTTGLTMNIVAHSMGARITLSALSALGGTCRTLGKPIVDELILAAPDVSSELYNDDFGHFLERSAPLRASRHHLCLGRRHGADRIGKRTWRYSACRPRAAQRSDLCQPSGGTYCRRGGRDIGARRQNRPRLFRAVLRDDGGHDVGAGRRAH